MKITLVEDIKYVWRYSTALVAYVGGSVATVWLTVLNEQQRLDLLALFGITPTMFAGYSALVVVVAYMFARTTNIEFKAPPREGE